MPAPGFTPILQALWGRLLRQSSAASCRRCGSLLEPGARSCRNCGAPTIGGAETVSADRRISRRKPALAILIIAGIFAGLVLGTVAIIHSIEPTLQEQGRASPGQGLPEFALSLSPTGPSEVRANEQVPIILHASITSPATKSEDLPLPGRRDYLLATQIQPGAFEVSPELLKVRREKLNPDQPIEWVWILAPKLDRLGEQRIAFDTDVFDREGIIKLGSRTLIATIKVKNPLGLPIWLVYCSPILGILGVIPIGSFALNWISDRLREKRESNRKGTQAAQNEIARDVEDKPRRACFQRAPGKQ
jgi:hypothetical protein